MNTKRTFILLTLMFFLATSARGQQFSTARNVPEKSYDPTQFEFSIADYNYTIFKSGRGRRKRNGETRSFNLRVSRSEHLTGEIYYVAHEGDLVLIGEVSDELYGGGFIARLDGRTLRIKWKRNIQGFNVGKGLKDGKYAYVTGIGFIGKIDLNAGRYVWQHDNLYMRDAGGAFNSFELPEVQGDLVIFKELPAYNRQKQAVVKVDRASGKVITLDH